MSRYRLMRRFAAMALCAVVPLCAARAVLAAEPSPPDVAPPAIPGPDGVVPEVDSAPTEVVPGAPAAALPKPALAPDPAGPASLELVASDGAPADAGPVAPPRPPLLERWWFWTAVAAIGVTAFVMIAASSTSGPPQTELGNRVAF